MIKFRHLLFVASVLALAGAGCSSSTSVDQVATTTAATSAVSANIDAAVSSAVNDSDSLDRSLDASGDQSQYKADDAQLNAYSDTSYDLK